MLAATARRSTALAALLAVTLGVGSTIVATPAGATGPSVSVATNVNPSAAGQRVVLKAKVVDPSLPTSAITGTATFSDGASVLGTAAVANATGSLATTALSAGDHPITVSFLPSVGGAAIVSAPLVQTVNAAATTTTLVTSNANAHYGDGGTITATVKPVAPGAGVPTGTVDFFVDGSWYWTSDVATNGKAVLALADLYPSFYPGTYAITATYNGDANYNPSSTAAAVAQTFIGLSTPPITTLTLDANGLPVFNPRSFTLSSVSPVGCNVTILNNTPNAQALAYGTPGAWKRLPGGGIAAGGAKGVGVGMANYTGYFTTVANTKNYVAIHCR